MWVLLLVFAGAVQPVAYIAGGATCEALAERLNLHAPKTEHYVCAERKET